MCIYSRKKNSTNEMVKITSLVKPRKPPSTQTTSYDGKASADPCSACMSMEAMEDPDNRNEYRESRRDDI